MKLDTKFMDNKILFYIPLINCNKLIQINNIESNIKTYLAECQ